MRFFLLKLMENKIRLLVSKGSCSFDDLLELTLAIQGINNPSKGDLPVRLEEIAIIQVPNSPYEQHEGTPFSNTRQEITECPTTYISRQTVYDSLQKQFPPEVISNIKRDLEEIFPPSAFECQLPLFATLDYILNNYSQTR